MRRIFNAAALAAAMVVFVCTSCGEYNPVEPDVPTLDVYPDSAVIEVSGSLDFDAGYEGDPHVVRWYVDNVLGGDPWKGVITTAGTFVAPANAPVGGSVTVRAKSLEDPALEGTATVRITASPTNSFVIVNPETSTVKVGAGIDFSSIVSGCGSDSVIWSLEILSGIATSGLGSIDDEGAYEAPATSGDNFEVLVRATSADCIEKSGIAKLTIPAEPRAFTVEMESFVGKFNVPGSAAIKAEHCGLASNGQAVTGLDRNGEYIDIPMYVRGAGNYLAFLRYASEPDTKSWVTIEVDGCGAAGSTAGFTLDQGEGTTWGFEYQDATGGGVFKFASGHCTLRVVFNAGLSGKLDYVRFEPYH